MDRRTFRGMVLWTTILSGLLAAGATIILQTLYWTQQFIPGSDGESLYLILSIVSSLASFMHTVSLLVFLVLIHRDLFVAERLGELARDYLVSDVISAPFTRGNAPPSRESDKDGHA